MSNPAAAPDAHHCHGGGGGAARTRRESRDPATGELLGTFVDGGAAQAGAAIAAARHAITATQWSRDRHLRAAALTEIADRLDARSDEIIDLLSRENGKTLNEAAFEVGPSAAKLRYYAALALSDHGRAAEVRPGMYSTTLKEPAGVAGIIVPWNSPVILSTRSFAPALAAGCTVAMKMPAQTGLVNELLAEIIGSAPSLPAGVVTVFTESGSDGARLLVSSPDVDVVSYTGSTAVGRQIMEAAAPTLKGLSLELGGKTPMIVFDDADLDAAVPVLSMAVTTFAGQFCMAGSRVLAHRGIADELRGRLVNALRAVRVGPGTDPSSDMGAMIDEASAVRVERTVADAAAHGTVLLRGSREGALLGPSLVEVTAVTAPIVQREVFGPVATFEVFDDERDAVERANATDFGLAAGVWTRDVDRPLRVGRDLRVGTVWTNTWAVVHDQFEEGGYKQSGVGRLNGLRGLEEFQETKHLVHTAP
ncbi:aldehyde dehydrogenase [Pseudonocardia sp. TMWB2A]|uniref:aldehyde dehydrogenase family protein n=1 Tax=Pseudonocardia sp. TMWB2A TaxID=687430 RepID=UPI00307F7F9B